MQPEDEALAEALQAAEEKAREVLDKLLGDRSSSYTILLKLEETQQGGYRVLIDIEASRPRARWIRELVEEATREAAREFERRLRQARRRASREEGGGTSSQER